MNITKVIFISNPALRLPFITVAFNAKSSQESDWLILKVKHAVFLSGAWGDKPVHEVCVFTTEPVETVLESQFKFITMEAYLTNEDLPEIEVSCSGPMLKTKV